MRYLDTNASAERLKLLRKMHGLRAVELAEKLGLTVTAVYKWEQGSAMPVIDNMVCLADIYNCTIDELIVRKECD